MSLRELSSLCAPTLSPFDHRGVKVNKDQVAGKAKGMFGKLQSAIGKLTGSKSQRVKRVAGKAQEALGDVRGAARRKPATRRSAGRARP
jgi:uncharacterized protein YjbJ (UPF0337 family)